MARRKTARRSRKPSRLSQWWQGLDTGHKARLRTAALWTVTGLCVLLGVGISLKLLEANILERRRARPVREVRVRFLPRPVWLPDRLAREVAADLIPPGLDIRAADAAREIHARATANPWLTDVREVRKTGGDSPGQVRLDVHASFRRPIARAGRDGRYFYVDTEGVRLPEGQVPRFVVRPPGSDGPGELYLTEADVPDGVRARRIHYIVIEGGRSEPPSVGRPWDTADLHAGLRLVRMVLDRPYAGQITVVDVSNHARRISDRLPELRMFAQVGSDTAPTEIRFGRFPDGPGDYVIAPERKLSYLDEYAARNDGRLTGANRYLDLRYDQLHVSLN